MKKIILATACLVAFGISSFAGGKDVDPKLLNDLSSTLRRSSQLHWTVKESFASAAFNFNDKVAFAFYDQSSNELIGFGIQFNKEDLPKSVSDAIDSKYSDWKVMDAMIFIDTNGYLNYFAQVQKNNKSLALKITPTGNLSVYAKMPLVNE